MLPYLIGFLLATGVFLFGRFVGLDRDRAFYATILIIVASYYGLFAIVGGSMSALGAEAVAIVGFMLLAVLGFKFSPWLLVAGLAGHGIFDFFHGGFITNPGLPPWWPPFCMTYDVTAAAGLAWLLLRAPGTLLSGKQ